MAKRFSIEAVFKAIDRFSRPVRRMQERTGKFFRATRKGMANITTGAGMVGAALKKMAVVGAISAVAIGGALGSVVSTGAEFEAQLIKAGAKFPGIVRIGTKSFGLLEAAALKVGEATEFSATQSAEALNFLAMAGFQVEQAIGALPEVANLATIAAVDLGRATDIATDALGAFGLRTKDTAQQAKNLRRVNDVIARTITSATLDVEQFYDAFKDGAPVARAAGAQIETTATLIARLADAGIKGTRAGTAIKRIFLAIGAPGSEPAKIFRRLGIQVTDADGKVRDILDVFKDLQTELGGLGQAKRLTVIDAIFGKIPIASAINLIDSAGDGLQGLREQIDKLGVSSEDMAAAMRSGTRFELLLLAAAWERVKISMFKAVKVPVMSALGKVIKFLKSNREELAKGFGKTIGFISSEITGLIDTLKRMGTGIGDLKFGLEIMLGIGMLVFKGLVLIVALLGGLFRNIGVAMAWWVRKIGAAVEAVSSAFRDVTEGIKDMWGRMVDWLAEKIAPIVTVIDKAVAELDKRFGGGSLQISAAEATANRQTFLQFEARGRQPHDNPAPQTVSPQERAAAINSTTTTRGEVVIRDETGRASPVGALPDGVQMESTGGF